MNNQSIDRNARDRLGEVTRFLLETQDPVWSLGNEVAELKSLFESIQPTNLADLGNICNGETRTENGLAVSPTVAILCVKEHVRTVQFLRGIHSAMQSVLKKEPGRPVRILYAGCGPFATLAVPLMTQFAPSEVSFTLLDIHEESIACAKGIINKLGLAEYVSSYEVVDASNYTINNAEQPDIIQMEIMKVCLESEPQVPVSRILLQQAPEAILIPQEVSIDLRLVNESREFRKIVSSHEFTKRNAEPLERERIHLGEVFVLNKEAIFSWNKHDTEQLPANKIEMPELWESNFDPKLFTTIQVFNEHRLEEYQSSLTYPQALKRCIKPVVNHGDQVQFYYRLGNWPKLEATVCH